MLEFYYSFSFDDRMRLMLISMIFLHIISDYILQTDSIAKFKQKKNWEEYDTEEKYKNDYKVMLLVHAFSWAIITFLPILVEFKDVYRYIIVVLGNTYMHALIDDQKCNKYKINLVQDQIFHLMQIGIVFTICIIAYY